MVNIFICSVFYGPLAFVIGDAGSASFPLNPSPPLVGSGVIGCEDGLRNDLYCVYWGVKLYSNSNSPPLVKENVWGLL